MNSSSPYIRPKAARGARPTICSERRMKKISPHDLKVGAMILLTRAGTVKNLARICCVDIL
jgi:hypothetical protein